MCANKSRFEMNNDGNCTRTEINEAGWARIPSNLQLKINLRIWPNWIMQLWPGGLVVIEKVSIEHVSRLSISQNAE